MNLDPEQLELDPMDQVATLCERELGALVFDPLVSVASLLETMWKAGAAEQVKALASRGPPRIAETSPMVLDSC